MFHRKPGLRRVALLFVSLLVLAGCATPLSRVTPSQPAINRTQPPVTTHQAITHTPMATTMPTGTPSATDTPTVRPRSITAPPATDTPTVLPRSTATSSATDTPTVLPTPTATPPATDTPTVLPTATPSATNTSPPTGCPTIQRKLATFQDIVEQHAPEPLIGSIFVREGQYTNDIGQAFVITVTGRLAEAVLLYTSKAKFCLLATAPKILTKAEPFKVRSGKSLFETLFKDDKTKNLVIDMDLTRADAEKLKGHYDLSFAVDPPIDGGATDHYRAQFVSPELTTILSASIGSVTANLFKDCVSSGPTQITGSGVTLPMPPSGYGWYDLAVTGNEDGSFYSIDQGLWGNYSYFETNYYLYSGVTCW